MFGNASDGGTGCLFSYDGDVKPDIVEKLYDLAQLRAAGLLSESEFQAAKKKILDRTRRASSKSDKQHMRMSPEAPMPALREGDVQELSPATHTREPAPVTIHDLQTYQRAESEVVQREPSAEQETALFLQKMHRPPPSPPLLMVSAPPKEAQFKAATNGVVSFPSDTSVPTSSKICVPTPVAMPYPAPRVLTLQEFKRKEQQDRRGSLEEQQEFKGQPSDVLVRHISMRSAGSVPSVRQSHLRRPSTTHRKSAGTQRQPSRAQSDPPVAFAAPVKQLESCAVQTDPPIASQERIAFGEEAGSMSNIIDPDEDVDLMFDESTEQYTGERSSNGKYEGEGHLFFKYGEYKGTFRDGQFEGQGKLTLNTGNVYEGEFCRGKQNGKGTMRYADGKVFVGEVANGRPFNYGEEKTAEYEYKGDFYDGDWHGFGEITYFGEHPKAGWKYVGMWVGGKYHGNGTLFSPANMQWAGCFSRGHPEKVRVTHGNEQWQEYYHQGKLVTKGSVGKVTTKDRRNTYS